MTGTPMRLFGRRVACMAAVLASLALAACTTSFPSVDAPMKLQSPLEGYVLEPGNRVRLTVFGEQSLSGDFALDPSGNIAVPLIGTIPASGVTANVLARRVEDALRRSNFMQDPRAAVEVLVFRPFYVLGEVRGPGEFPYTSGMTVLSAVARAGGYDYRAREGEVVLMRIVNGEQMEYRAVERTPILPGDIIKVLERRF